MDAVNLKNKLFFTNKMCLFRKSRELQFGTFSLGKTTGKPKNKEKESYFMEKKEVEVGHCVE